MCHTFSPARVAALRQELAFFQNAVGPSANNPTNSGSPFAGAIAQLNRVHGLLRKAGAGDANNSRFWLNPFLPEHRRVAEERRMATALKNLNLRLGRTPDDPVRAEGPLLFLEPVGTRAELLQEALELRPDLKASEAGLQAVRYRVTLVQAERLFPEIELALRYEDDRDFDARDRRVMLDLTIPLPLFNRRQGEAEVALAEQIRQEARIALIRAQIETEVATAFEQFQSSQQIVEEFVQQILPQHEQNFGLLREGYTLGQFDLTDVLLAQRELIDVRFAYLEAIGEFNTAAVDLRRAVGLTTHSPARVRQGPGLPLSRSMEGTNKQRGYQP